VTKGQPPCYATGLHTGESVAYVQLAFHVMGTDCSLQPANTACCMCL
jgi:hypothetical protein